jgi:hypothetical protein
MRPRLRPCWRIAINIQVMLALFAFAGWTGRALGAALADHDMKEIQVLIDRRLAEWQMERTRMELEQDKARRTALSSDYAPGDEQLCELLYNKEVAVCDRAALERLAAAAAHQRVEPSPVRARRGAASTAQVPR